MFIDLVKIKSKMEATWVPFRGEAELKIRPFPRSKSDFTIKDGAVIFTGQKGLEAFLFCLEDWKGFVDPSGQPVKLTDDIKKIIFESGVEGISNFVVQENMKRLKEMETEEKNS